MSGYSHLSPAERDQIALRLRRAASTISRELRRNALESGAYRPQIAVGAYLLRRKRLAILEGVPVLAAYVALLVGIHR